MVACEVGAFAFVDACVDSPMGEDDVEPPVAIGIDIAEDEPGPAAPV